MENKFQVIRVKVIFVYNVSNVYFSLKGPRKVIVNFLNFAHLFSEKIITVKSQSL